MSVLWLWAGLQIFAAPSGRSVLADLQNLDRELVAAEENLLTVEGRRAEIQKELLRIDTDLAATRVRKAEAFAAFQRRVRALARMPAGARLVLLGGSRSLADYLEASRVLRWVAAHDRKLQTRYLAEAEKLSRLEEEITTRQKTQEELVQQARAERDAVAKHRQERLELLQSIAADRDLRELAAKERGTARRQLTNMIEKMAPKGDPAERFAANEGRLPWPAAGPVDVAFGQRVERAYGTVTSHNGLDIRAKAGSPVQAVAAGRVVFADWLEGYGQLVIVDHGEHYHSLVAHLGRIDVAVGDQVSAGTVLGTVGDTGSMRGTVLYFEIRDHGTPVDPAAWLRP